MDNPNATRAPRRGIDPFTLIVGIGALFVASLAFSEHSWLSTVDARWLLAGGAMLAGLLLLTGAARRPRTSR